MSLVRIIKRDIIEVDDVFARYTMKADFVLWVRTIERFHSIPRDIKDKEKGGHVGLPNNR